MNPGCPFRDKFNLQIRRLQEAGLLSKWLQQIIHDPKRRETEATDTSTLPKGQGPQALGLNELQGVFYIFFMGITFATAIFVGERRWTLSSL